jgi:hypothetical protein
MTGRRSVAKTVALCCAGLIALLVVVTLAGYVLMRAAAAHRARTALARLKASGAPTTWAEVIPPPIPDDQNAAVVYDKAFAHLRPDYAFREQALLQRYLRYHVQAPAAVQRKAMEGDVGRILAVNAQALALLRQAAGRPECRFESAWHCPPPLPDGPDERHRLDRLSDLLCAQAMLRADRGDAPGALEALRVNLAIAKHQESHPFPRGVVYAHDAVERSLAPLHRVLEVTSPDREGCTALDRALRRLDLASAQTCQVMNLRAAALDNLRAARDARAVQIVPVLHYPLAATRVMQTLHLPHRDGLYAPYAAVAPWDEAAFLAFWDKCIALQGKPWREAGKEWLALYREPPQWALLAQMSESLGANPLSRDLALANSGLMRIALGVHAYRGQCRRYPGSLAELRRTLGRALPTDPFSGKDFVYRREPRGYLLYSVGLDLKDDGGVGWRMVPDPKTGLLRQGGDLVWRMDR